MAVPACFHLADDVFPRVRAEAARRLVAAGWSQARIADVLHVSQAMVSKYQSRPAETDALALRLVDELIDGIEAPVEGASAWCTTLSIQQGVSGADEALADLLRAEQTLLASPPLAIMPQVGLNIARAVPDATDSDGVLAYPARIVAAGDRIIRPAPPAFGASHHLAACLLALRARDPAIHAIANIRGGPDIARGAELELHGDGDRVELFQAAIATAPNAPRRIHDPGAIGIEPCLYIAGPTARDVVDQILSIQQQVNP